MDQILGTYAPQYAKLFQDAGIDIAFLLNQKQRDIDKKLAQIIENDDDYENIAESLKKFREDTAKEPVSPAKPLFEYFGNFYLYFTK